MDNFKILQDKRNIFPESTLKRLYKVKLIRNLGAHHTRTVMAESIDYTKCTEVFSISGELLNSLGMLDKTDVNPSPEKLRAKTGDLIGDCCLLNEYIGGGAGGRVFKAHHQRLDITVAVKEINYDLKENINIENEKNILLSIKHNGVPRVYDVLYDNQTVYFIMEYIDGINLAELINKSGPLPLSRTIGYGLELCNILLHLHQDGETIIYNDLKPSNIILGTDNRLYMVDFGTSCKRKSNGDNNVHYMGSLGYSSPEQLNDNFSDERSDIYSLGGVLYFLVEGVNPPIETERKYSRNTPSYIIDLIEKCMAKNPVNRFLNIQELIYDLSNALHEHENAINHNQGAKKDKKLGFFTKKRIIISVLILFFISTILTIWVISNNNNKVYTDTQFYKAVLDDSLKQADKIVIAPKHVYFMDSKLYMSAFVYNGYDHDIKEVRDIHIILSSGNDVIATKSFRSVVKNIKSNNIHEYLFTFDGSSIKNSNVDLSTLKWNISFNKID